MATQSTVIGPINSKTTKKALQKIAKELRLDDNGTKDVLMAQINTHLDENEASLSKDPRFQGLYTGRAGNPKKGNSKTSADKAAEDTEAGENDEASKPTKSYQTLLDNGYSTDPAAKYLRLNSLDGSRGPKDVGGRSSQQHEEEENDESRPLSPLSSLHDDDDDLENKKKPPVAEITDPLIMVIFEHENRPDAGSCETYVSGVPVIAETDGKGDIRFAARLTDVLPQSVAQASPIKKPGTSVWRSGVADPSSRSKLGNFKDLSDPVILKKKLKFDIVDKHPLEQLHPNTYALKLYWKEDGSSSLTLGGQPDSNSTNSSPSEPPIVRARASLAAKKVATVAARDAQASGAASKMEGFPSFLQRFLGLTDEEVYDMKAPAETMREVVDRSNLRQEWVTKLKDECRRKGSSNGGFQIGHDPKYNEFAGHCFTLQDIWDAVLMGKTQISNDKAILSDRYLACAPKAREWVGDPDGRYATKFNNMRISEFKKYVEAKAVKKEGPDSKMITKAKGMLASSDEETTKKKPKQKDSGFHSGGKSSKKRPRESGSENERSGASKKGKKSSRVDRDLHSDDLDEDTGSEEEGGSDSEL